MLDWSDKRPIEELRFGTEWKPTLGDLHAQQPGFGAPDAPFGLREGDPPGDEVERLWKETHAAARERMLDCLKRCNCVVAGDIVQVGCTGASACLSSIDEIKFLRLGLGGSGVGLPCFVPPDRYCLAHEVSGGLQDGQEPRFQGRVEFVSRPLTAQEATESALVDHAKGSTEADASDLLAGRKLPEGWEHDESESPEPSVEMQVAARASGPALNWECPEHKETMWACRYCVAQAIVEGELVPALAVRPAIGGFTKAGVSAREAMEEVAYLDMAGAARVDLYVLAATFTRKLAR